MNIYDLDASIFFDFIVDLTEKDIFNIFGKKDLGFPLFLTETDVFNLFKFIGLGVPFALTKDEMADVVLCLKRVKVNKFRKSFEDDMKILISEDENGKILLD